MAALTLNIQVVNKHHGAVGEFIGRGSPLGNPFKLKSAGGEYTRDEAIACYEAYLRQAIDVKHTGVITELNRLYDRIIHNSLQGKPTNLLCFCAPHACHGDVIKKIIIEAHEELHIRTR